MNLEYDATDGDYVRARLYHASGALKKPIFWPTRRLILILVVVGVVPILFDSKTGRIGTMALINAVILFSIALFLTFGQKHMMLRAAHRTSGAIGPRQTKISEDFLETNSATEGVVLRWPVLSRIEILDGDIYCATNVAAMFIIPERAFGSSDQAQMVFETMTAYRDAAIQRMPLAPSLDRPESTGDVWPPAPASTGYVEAMPEVGPALDTNGTLSIRVHMTIEDSLDALRAAANRVTLIACVAMVAILALEWLVSSGHPSALVGGGAAGIVCVVLLRVFAGRSFDRVASKNFNGIRESLCDYKLATDFITVKIESTETIGYFAVADTVLVNRFRQVIGIQTSPLHQFGIPLRSFANTVDSAGFERRLREAVKTQQTVRKSASSISTVRPAPGA